MDMMVILNQMIQLFLIMALGYMLFKMKIFDETFNKKLTSFILLVTTPCLIISSVMSSEVSQDYSSILFVFIVGVILYVGLPVVGWIIAKVLRVPTTQQGLYIFMTVFSNIGFMGFPVMKSIFGDSAVFYTSIFNMIFNIFVYTLGVVLINMGTDKKGKIELKNLFSPAVIASFVALIVYFTHLQLPTVITNTISTVGDLTSPIAMLIIGSTLATIPLKEVFNELRIYPYTLLKQVLVPIISYPILTFFIKDPLILGITLVMISMPVGNSAVLFSTEYDGDTALAAKTVFMTTLLSIVTIPLIVGLFLA